jgi:hypothetical protein
MTDTTTASRPDLVNFDRVLPNGERDTVLVLPEAVTAIASAPGGHADLILIGKQIRVVEGPHAAAELLGLTVTGSLAHTIGAES